MNRTLPALLAIATVMTTACGPHSSAEPIADYDPLPLVDPFIGTGGLGAEVVGLNPGASAPFGFVQAGPDTRSTATGQPGFYHFGGYHYEDDRIDGFSHTHANGMGVNDLGGIHLMPRSGWDDEYVRGKKRAAPFDHDQESAGPGWYSVTLLDDGTQVDIAASPRGAVHRYRFSDPANPVLILDLAYAIGDIEIPEASISIDGATVRAFQRVDGSYSRRTGGMPHYAYAELDPAPISSGVWGEDRPPAPGTEIDGLGVGAWMTFPEGTTEVTLRIALSTTGAEGAKINFDSEVSGHTLEEVRGETEAAWRTALSTVKVRGGTQDQQVIAHTAAYHAYLWPNLYQDVDGTYRGFDNELHTAEHDYHSAFSLWDTFRTVHPLLTLTMPRRHESMLKSLLLMGEQGGDLPRWPIGNGYTGGMIGAPGAIVLAEAHLKGLDFGDSTAAFDLAVQSAEGPRPNAGRAGIEPYRDVGYVPFDEHSGSASRTLEFAWADHSLSLWANDLGKGNQGEMLAAQSTHWANTWDPAQEAFVGRNSDGSFNELSTRDAWTPDYVEGTAWQYLFGAPTDVQGMIDLQDGGDRDRWLTRLDSFWDDAKAEPDDLIYDSYYWHGNEPDLHYAFLGSLAGDRERTADAVRWVLQTRYDTSPAGLDGNDDAGTLSSWYILASAGIYPIAGTTQYALGSPLFERVELGDGLVVRAEGLDDGGTVPVEVWLGDQRIEGGVIEHADLMAAGELRFVLE
ncbi:MAG: GH92 family glycosyl hydrolase [Myxococcota bacterium]